MTVTFINLFDIPEGRDDAFLALWQEVNDYMRGQRGYVSHKLHRTLVPSACYRFVNIAIWENQQDWDAAHDESFRALVSQPAWQEFTPLPALYEVVHEAQTARSARV